MVDYTTTPAYAFKMPTDHVNANTWGGYNNGNWSSVDGLIGSIRGQLGSNYCILTKTNSVEADVQYNGVIGTSKLRWTAGIDALVESGSNVNSNYHIKRFDDNGNLIDTPFTIVRSTGDVYFTGQITAAGVLDDIGYTISRQTGAGDVYFVMQTSAGVTQGYLTWNHTNGAVSLYNATGGANLALNTDGSVSTSGALHVGGNMNTTGITVSGNAVVNGSLNAYNTTVTGLTVNGAAVVNGALSAYNTTVTGLIVNGTAAVNGALSSGALTSSGIIQSNGGNFILKQTTGDYCYQIFDAGSTWRGEFGCRGSSDSSVGVFTNYSGGYGAANFYIDGAGNFIYQGGTGSAQKQGGGSWASISDARIKTVIGDYAEGLEAILQLRPVTYTFKGNDTPSADVNGVGGDPEAAKPTASAAPYPASSHYNPAKSGKQFVGFVAQELETIFPSMVNSAPGFIDGQAVSDLRSVDPSELIYALVNAVKELKAEIEALKAAR